MRWNLGRRRLANLALASAICVAVWIVWDRLEPRSQRRVVQVHPPAIADPGYVPSTAKQPWIVDQEQSVLTPKPATDKTAKPASGKGRPKGKLDLDHTFPWRTIKHHFPVTAFDPIPTGPAHILPKVQAIFPSESTKARDLRLDRQAAIKKAFVRSWEAYKQHAWLADEVAPITGKARNTFGAWGATLVDALDTLWIMGLKADFEAAVKAVQTIDFGTTEAKHINVFETNIRFLGGLLAAYDLSGDARLLAKAVDVGDLLYKSFDTPNHLPITRWNLHAAAEGKKQSAPGWTPLAEAGSLSLEFTRLSILTGDPKYFTAVQQVAERMERAQMQTKLPGLWSTAINAAAADFDATGDYTIGGMADSAYEYLIKMVALVGDQVPVYKMMYTRAMETVQSFLLYRPLTPTNDDILVSGTMSSRKSDNYQLQLEYTGQHLACFAGGMFALGGALLSNETHLSVGKKLTDGCIWAYASMPSGIMPEKFHLTPCTQAPCTWSPAAWHAAIFKHHGITPPSPSAATSIAESLAAEKHLPPSFIDIADSRYVLRPEAIEAVFVLYRTTGDLALRERAWAMWSAIEAATRTELAYSAVWGVETARPRKSDGMESFWLGETLKYFYLMFAEPGVVSLDEWVFNTEAHPLRRLGR